MMYSLFHETLGASLWVDHLVYTVLFYVIQEKVDMKIMKKIIRSLAIQWLKTSTGLDGYRVEEILREIESKEMEKGIENKEKSS